MKAPPGKTRRTVRAATAIAFVVSTIGLSTAASAKAPAPVSIEAIVTSFAPEFVGVWQASGAIDDAGSFERTDLHFSHSGEHSPVVSTFQALFEFSGTQGTFILRVELLFHTSSGLTGKWQVVSGTGAYARASGHGSSVFLPSTSTIVFTGVLSLKP